MILQISTWLRNRPLLLLISLFLLTGCAGKSESQGKTTDEEETIARTEFTERIENFFEYEPLKVDKSSQFRIHLTDLSDGSPVEKANVTLIIRSNGNNKEVVRSRAKVGKVTGIYVAEVNVKQKGLYNIEFDIKNAKLNEHMPLTNFKVE